MLRHVLIFCVVLGSPAASQAGKATVRGTLEGDVYLMMQNGDTKKGAGGWVKLIRSDSSLVNNLQAICRDHYDVSERLEAQSDSVRARSVAMTYKDLKLGDKLSDSASALAKASRLHMRQGTDDTRSILRMRVVDSARTGMNAHYRFSSVRPGNYLLFYEWEIANNLHQWITSVAVGVGQTITLDLDNEALEKKICGPTVF